MLGRNREEFSLKHFLCHSIKTLDPTVSTLQKIPKETPLPSSAHTGHFRFLFKPAVWGPPLHVLCTKL